MFPLWIDFIIIIKWTFLVSQMVKNQPAIQETQIWPLGQENTLQKGPFTYFSILTWRIPRTQGPGRLQSTGLQRVGQDRALCCAVLSHSVFSSSLQPHGLLPTRPCVHGDFPGKNISVDFHALFYGIFAIQVFHIASGYFTICATREARSSHMMQ